MVAGTLGSLDKEGARKMPKTITLTAGIDTSKSKLDVGIHGQKRSETFENAQAGWGRLQAWLTSEGVGRVGIEATGGYERGVTRHLQNAGVEVVVLQPKQVKAFGQLHLRRAKSDRIDAFLIAACTYLLDAQNRMPPDPRFDALADHLTYIEQIEEDMTRFKTRLEHIGEARVRRTINADVSRLAKRRDHELKRLQAALQAYPDLARRFDLVLSIPGIGARTALSIVVRLPELGQISREQVASLAGLAPFVQQSGKWKGETHICGGRERLRRALYAASLPAAFHWNPALKALYARLTQRGKSHTSALVACARKLLIYANTVVTRGTPWVDEPSAA
jgi:transposase